MGVFAAIVASAFGHAHMVVPPPRNAVDKDLAPWNGSMPTTWNHHVDSYICPTASGIGMGLSLRNGWVSVPNVTHQPGQFPCLPLTRFVPAGHLAGRRASTSLTAAPYTATSAMASQLA